MAQGPLSCHGVGRKTKAHMGWFFLLSATAGHLKNQCLCEFRVKTRTELIDYRQTTATKREKSEYNDSVVVRSEIERVNGEAEEKNQENGKEKK